MELSLIRTPSRKTCTISMLFEQPSLKKECYILEDIVREVAGQPVASWKIPNQTAIPTGRYQVILSFSPHFKGILPEIKNVPGFTGVRIHGGNRSTDTEGCLITGSSIGTDGESVTGSDIARDALYTKLALAISAGEQVWLTIS